MDSNVEPFAKNLGQVLSQVRLRYDISQETVAARAGITLSILQQVENGTIAVNIGTISKIATALQLDLSFVMFITANITPFNGRNSQMALANALFSDSGHFCKQEINTGPTRKTTSPIDAPFVYNFDAENGQLEYFATNLRRIMFDAGITQTALAEYLGVTQACVSHWTKGRSYPQSIKIIREIAEFLGVDIKELRK